MIPTNVFANYLMKHFEFKEATSYNPHLENSTIRFDARQKIDV